MAEESRDTRADHLEPWVWKPGESGNPNGRPRNVLRNLCAEMNIDIREAVPLAEKVQFINRMLEMTLKQLKDIAGDVRAPAWMVMVASAIRSDISAGRMTTLEALLDRVHGRPTQAINLMSWSNDEKAKELEDFTDAEIVEELERLDQSTTLKTEQDAAKGSGGESRTEGPGE